MKNTKENAKKFHYNFEERNGPNWLRGVPDFVRYLTEYGNFLEQKLPSYSDILKNILLKWSCRHEWRCEIERPTANDWGENYTSYTYVCDKCGKFKKWKSS